MTATHEKVQSTPVVESIDSLGERQQRLAERLETGFQRIERAELKGSDVSEWESLWVSLLQEYEAVCDLIRQRS